MPPTTSRLPKRNFPHRHNIRHARHPSVLRPPTAVHVEYLESRRWSISGLPHSHTACLLPTQRALPSPTNSPPRTSCRKQATPWLPPSPAIPQPRPFQELAVVSATTDRNLVEVTVSPPAPPGAPSNHESNAPKAVHGPRSGRGARPEGKWPRSRPSKDLTAATGRKPSHAATPTATLRPTPRTDSLPC